MGINVGALQSLPSWYWGVWPRSSGSHNLPSAPGRGFAQGRAGTQPSREVLPLNIRGPGFLFWSRDGYYFPWLALQPQLLGLSSRDQFPIPFHSGRSQAVRAATSHAVPRMACACWQSSPSPGRGWVLPGGMGVNNIFSLVSPESKIPAPFVPGLLKGQMKGLRRFGFRQLVC